MTPTKTGDSFDVNRCIEHAEDIKGMAVTLYHIKSNTDKILDNLASNHVQTELNTVAIKKLKKKQWRWFEWLLTLLMLTIIALETWGINALASRVKELRELESQKIQSQKGE